MSTTEKLVGGAVIAAILIGIAIGLYFGLGSSSKTGDSDHAQDCWTPAYAATHGGRRHCAT